MTHADFLCDIAANPADLRPRLTFADWLEEHDEPARAEYIRLAVELVNPSGLQSSERGYVFDTKENCDRFELLRSRLDALLTPERRRAWTMAGLPEGWNWFSEQGNDGKIWLFEDSNSPEFKLDFNRGFPEVVTCRWEEWQRHHKAICAAHPIRKVRLTTFEGPIWSDRVAEFIAIEIPGADPVHPIEYELAATLAREPATR